MQEKEFIVNISDVVECTIYAGEIGEFKYKAIVRSTLHDPDYTPYIPDKNEYFFIASIDKRDFPSQILPSNLFCFDFINKKWSSRTIGKRFKKANVIKTNKERHNAKPAVTDIVKCVVYRGRNPIFYTGLVKATYDYYDSFLNGEDIVFIDKYYIILDFPHEVSSSNIFCFNYEKKEWEVKKRAGEYGRAEVTII